MVLILMCLYLQVMLTPNTEWGGEGSLGCGIGYGYLHRIPETFVASQDPSDPESGGVATDVPDAGKELEGAIKTAPSMMAAGGGMQEGYAEVRGGRGRGQCTIIVITAPEIT